MNRRKFLLGAAAVAVAGPTVTAPVVAAPMVENLTKAALLRGLESVRAGGSMSSRFLIVRGYDAYNNPITEWIPVPDKEFYQ